MKNKSTIIIIIIVIAVVNVAMMGRNIDCSYSNSSGSFTFEEMNFKERNFDMCQRVLTEFKKENSDTVLYRLCSKNFLAFWNWGAYLYQKKFRLPYTSWAEIKAKRGPVRNKSGFQDF